MIVIAWMMQYGALRRKIGGTYRDFFKDSVEGMRSLNTENRHFVRVNTLILGKSSMRGYEKLDTKVISL